MSALLSVLRCSCCGAEITCPQFHNGKPYGWTCIHKVAPGQKRIKKEYLAVDRFRIVSGEGTQRQVFKVEYQGRVFSIAILTDKNTGTLMGAVLQDGILYVHEDKLK